MAAPPPNNPEDHAQDLLLDPVVIGRGARLFLEGTPRHALQLAGTAPLRGRMTLLRYTPPQVAVPA